jgi:hypothetical protein
LPLLTIPLRWDQILISKISVGRKTSEVVENADESSFGEGQVIEIAKVGGLHHRYERRAA